MSHPAIKQGGTAVITGGSSGIGYAAAKKFAAEGMNVVIADLDEKSLQVASTELGENVLTVCTDVSILSEVEALRDAVMNRYGGLTILMNNAGTAGGGGPFDGYQGWQKVLSVNLWGVVHGLQTFTQLMIDQGEHCAIINTGSKQGITNPPGDAAYNVSKAGVKTLTESLAYQLRNIESSLITAHLLVPGYTYTGLTKQRTEKKPDAAWEPEQVIDYMLKKMDANAFYIICPDNDVSEALDNARMLWHMQDMVDGRPALSRWHEDYKADFLAFTKKFT